MNTQRHSIPGLDHKPATGLKQAVTISFATHLVLVLAASGIISQMQGTIKEEINNALLDKQVRDTDPDLYAKITSSEAESTRTLQFEQVVQLMFAIEQYPLHETYGVNKADQMQNSASQHLFKLIHKQQDSLTYTDTTTVFAQIKNLRQACDAKVKPSQQKTNENQPYLSAMLSEMSQNKPCLGNCQTHMLLHGLVMWGTFPEQVKNGEIELYYDPQIIITETPQTNGEIKKTQSRHVGLVAKYFGQYYFFDNLLPNLKVIPEEEISPEQKGNLVPFNSLINDFFGEKQERQTATTDQTIPEKEFNFQNRFQYQAPQVVNTMRETDFNDPITVEIKYNDENTEAKIAKYQKLIAEHPEDAKNYKTLGQIYSGNQDYEQALFYLHKADSLEPENADINFDLGFVYRRAGDHTEAKKFYEKAIKLNPNDEHSYIDLSKIYNDEKDFSKTISLLETALIKMSDDDRLHNNIGVAYFHSGQQHKLKSHAHFLKAYELNPTNEIHAYNLANSYNDRGDHQQAISILQAAINTNPNNLKYHFYLALLFILVDKPQEALKSLNTAVQLAENKDVAETRDVLENHLSPELILLAAENGKLDDIIKLTDLLAKNNLNEQALPLAKKLVELEPEKAIHYERLANAQYARTEYQPAITSYKKAISLGLNTSNIYNQIGNSFYVLEQYQEALNNYQHAIRIDPEDTTIRENIASTQTKLEQFQEAIKTYEELINLNPSEAGKYKKEIERNKTFINCVTP